MRAAQKIKSPITAGVAKVPVVMQMEALECGAASLAMILAYYEKWVPLEQVRLDCGVSRDGSNARNILRAARSYGLIAKGYRYEPEGLKANGKFPCIIHWNFNHFVVLNGFRGNKAVLNDPAKGTYSVPMQTFDDSFTGICLFFEPAEGFVPEGKPQSMLQYAKKRLVGAGTAIAFVTLTTVISSLLGIVTPAFSRIFLDRLLTGENPEWLMSFTLALAGISVLQLIVAWIQAVYSLRINGKLAGTTVAGIEMIETIKASGAENGFFEKWAGYQASVNTSQVRFQRMNQLLGLLPALVSSICSTAVLMTGVFLAMQGSFTVGMIMAFQGFLSSFLSPATTLISAGQTLQEMRTDMERIEDVMRYPDDDIFAEDGGDESAEYGKLSGNIELKNVTFGYSRLAEPLIRDFNLTLRPGDRVAFVGASGCGKSTISKLISGLYKPWSGEILFDGKPISQIDRCVFTGSLAVVDQDIILFEDTIANNIKMWDNSIEDFEMIMAARDAQLHEDIMRREGGYQYKLTEGGKDLSGGQRQRMEIARVLAQDPTIILLDEATSALDAKTEYDVVRSIKDRGITCIVVAHRLSTIRDCDEIIVMEQGNVVERGTHEELMKNGGAYTRLVSNE